MDTLVPYNNLDTLRSIVIEIQCFTTSLIRILLYLLNVYIQLPLSIKFSFIQTSQYFFCISENLQKKPFTIQTIIFAVVIIGFVPDEYQVNEAEGVVTFRIELITGVLDKDLVVEFFTEDGSAEG